MELNDLKKTWQKVSQNPDLNYSVEEIDQFRKSRSKDFSKWIRSALFIDFVIKAVLATSFVVLFFLFSEKTTPQKEY